MLLFRGPVAKWGQLRQRKSRAFDLPGWSGEEVSRIIDQVSPSSEYQGFGMFLRGRIPKRPRIKCSDDSVIPRKCECFGPSACARLPANRAHLRVDRMIRLPNAIG